MFFVVGRVGVIPSRDAQFALPTAISHCMLQLYLELRHGANIMSRAFFFVRAVVAEHLREKFDHWDATDRLPQAFAVLKAEKSLLY